jgi:catechol 2,3-dioxygenase-like lactoylglutathione lyase family enzyme
MIIVHIGVTVSDFEKSKAFYIRALEPLGIRVLMEGRGWAGMGRGDKPEFWFGPGVNNAGPVHVAFAAENRERVRAFYAAAIAAGGRDNGPPGPRPLYHPGYYGAFVLDPDGHNIEAVCHRPE